ncbi:photosystem II protein PsbQ [Phormidium tenue FACHB-886]|nr:photosystem II protein PsbQ [Phormidium tenue FACHB-886]
MKRLRSVLVLCLVLMTTLLVSCGSPTAVKPTYTATQLEQIQKNAEGVQELRDRLLELPPLIQKQEWIDVANFIHGPLGELRVRMSRLSRSLLPDAQQPALKSAKAVFGHIDAIDEAAQARDTNKALRNYNEALKDFDAFFSLLPQGS